MNSLTAPTVIKLTTNIWKTNSIKQSFQSKGDNHMQSEHFLSFSVFIFLGKLIILGLKIS